MTYVETRLPCPLCLFVGEYTVTPAFRGSASARSPGVPLLIWNMSWCGHQFTSEKFVQVEGGWVRRSEEPPAECE